MLDEIRNNFVSELTKAAKNELSSLSYIRHPLPAKPRPAHSQIFQVIVIGGSICKKAFVRKEAESIHLEEIREEIQPFFTTKEQFFAYLHTHISPQTTQLACNFAYALSPVLRNSHLDGMLISGSKENAFLGLQNTIVGEEIEKSIKRPFSCSVANDAICLLLSTRQKREDLVGAVLGTGTNITFFAQDEAINIESGNFDKFTQSHSGKKIAAASANPTKGLFEKEIAGAYLFHHYNVLSGDNTPLASTKQLQELALSSQQTEAHKLAQKLITHSAELFAVQLSAVAEWKARDIIVAIEGSMYWNNEIYQSIVKDTLQKLSPRKKITIISVPNSSLLGAAMLFG